MKKILLFLLLAFPLQAQDIVLKHKNYTSTFSKTLRYPTQVEWVITKASLNCKTPATRTDKFLPDPLLILETDINEDYVGSGFDRGHLSPAADNKCVVGAMGESFYFSNMAPQYPGLNRGQWKSLEEWTRQLAETNDSVLVKAGCVGKAKLIKRVTVPTHCWKSITVKKTNTTTHYVFPNVPERTASFTQHQVTSDSIKKLRTPTRKAK